jgi:membrane peptidoglycan carboxypeptidase
MRILKLTLLIPCVILILAIFYCVGILYNPYVVAVEQIHKSQPLSSYPSILVSTVLLIESPSYLSQGKATSNITYQAIRNLSYNGSSNRMLLHVALPFLLEITESKERILSMYLGSVYLGSTVTDEIRGMQQASNYYFQKQLVQLSNSDIALLVALMKGPSYYNANKNPERALTRRNIILKEMKKSGALTDCEYNEAISAPLPPSA